MTTSTYVRRSSVPTERQWDLAVVRGPIRTRASHIYDVDRSGSDHWRGPAKRCAFAGAIDSGLDTAQLTDSEVVTALQVRVVMELSDNQPMTRPTGELA